ncbi:FemAB family XrtA/PEP-CTERM system-associated protein [Stakelama tenebrarum]|uniref:FemAB family PEP-CTERM system-associated protein n=1 Tax=Stakelama tenebrarum TaxID=2711215 RepID=A0A6G6Y6Y6_9SPHN|nr:FemAB family XrtA/PEP-CTERM system-associated protein [Sphingosinithalassobacter tenebrarum]QIG80685.1 FemAB family PEP-CTERM system-associated protein [Sphingosinithalassobacter tenebrarum]
MNAPMLNRTIAVREADLTDPIERARIGAFVHDHADGTPFHLPAWSVAVARGCGQKAHYLIAERGEDRLVGVLPLTEVHSPLFGRALVSAGFGVGGGILSDGAGAVAPLAAAGWRLAESVSCPTLELRGGAHPGGGWHADSTSYCGFARDLAPDEEAELKAVPRKQRAEIRKALANDLEISVGCNEADAAAHYRVYAESVRNLGTPVFPRGLFSEVLREFGSSADILIVRHLDVPVASVLSIYWNGTVYPYWGGGTHAARALRANDRMYFSLMQHARERGCTRFDFGRSKVGTGAAAFKKNWGFDPQPLTYFKRARDGEAPREINPLSPKYRLQVAAWQRLPLALANRLGPWISRGLG